MVAEPRSRSTRPRKPALHLELVEPEVVPMTPEQRREFVRILSGMIMGFLQETRLRSQPASEDAGPPGARKEP